jgi:hypothetical protein
MGILMGVLDDDEVRMMQVGVRLGARGGQGGVHGLMSDQLARQAEKTSFNVESYYLSSRPKSKY